MAGTGEFLGSLAGGALGSAILPGIGTAVGSQLGSKIGGAIDGGSSSASSTGSGGGKNAAGLGLATGLLQTLKSNQLGNQANASMPDYVDPNQASFLSELNQKRKSIETGADFAEAMQEADQSQASANDAILKASGGDSGGAIQGLLQSQQVAGMNKNRAIAAGQQQQFANNQMYGNLLNLMSARKLELELYNTDRALANQAATKQSANQNVMAGLGGLLSGNQTQPGNATPSANAVDAGDTFSGPDSSMPSSLSTGLA